MMNNDGSGFVRNATRRCRVHWIFSQLAPLSSFCKLEPTFRCFSVIPANTAGLSGEAKSDLMTGCWLPPAGPLLLPRISKLGISRLEVTECLQMVFFSF